MNLVYELLRAGKTSADSDTGAEVARKINSNFEKVKQAFSEVEQTVANSVVRAIENGDVEIPTATDEVAGTIKSSDGDNTVSVNSDGTAKVEFVNVNTLVQDEDDFLVFDGKNS